MWQDQRSDGVAGSATSESERFGSGEGAFRVQSRRSLNREGWGGGTKKSISFLSDSSPQRGGRFRGGEGGRQPRELGGPVEGALSQPTGEKREEWDRGLSAWQNVDGRYRGDQSGQSARRGRQRSAGDGSAGAWRGRGGRGRLSMRGAGRPEYDKRTGWGRPADLAKELMQDVDSPREEGAEIDRRMPRAPPAAGKEDSDYYSRSSGPDGQSSGGWSTMQGESEGGGGGGGGRDEESGSKERPGGVVPKNLSSYKDLGRLLEVFEGHGLARVRGAQPSDAVAAMNHLKRLHGQARRDRALNSRLETIFEAFASSAFDGMDSMPPAHGSAYPCSVFECADTDPVSRGWQLCRPRMLPLR